jgi:O-glycosyl hydrolase
MFTSQSIGRRRLKRRPDGLVRTVLHSLALAAAGLAAIQPASAVSVTVDANTQFQTIQGWGACPYVGAMGDTGPYFNASYRTLYTQDLGCNIVRMEVDPTILMAAGGNLTGPEVTLGSNIDTNAALFNFEDSRHRAVDDFCKYVALNALEPSRVKFMASIWTPPHWAKQASGTIINGSPAPVILNCNTCDTAGGTWKDDHFQYNARYIAAFCKRFGTYVGSPLYGISIQNELSFENPFNSCSLVQTTAGTDNNRYSNALKAVKDEFALHPEVTTKIMGPHMAAIGDTPDNPWSLTQQMNIIDGVKNHADTTLKNFLSIYTNNYASSQPARMYAAYWNGKANVTGAWAAWTNANGIAADGKESWNSEAGGESPTWPGPLTQANTEQSALTFGNYSAYIYWQCSDGSATVGDFNLLGTNDFANPQGSKKYCMYKHFSRYIRPGSKRVKMTFSNGTPSNGGSDQWDTGNATTVSAYTNTTDGRVTMVIVNSRTVADTLTITVPTSPNVTTYNQFRTSSTENFANIGNLTVSGGAITVSVPASSVITLTGVASGVPPVPTGLTATAGNAQVALSWNASTGATAYDVKRSTVSGSGYATISSPTTTSYTNTGLTNGTTYYYVVAAKNAGGSSANSTQASATPSAGVSGLVKINAGGPAVSPFVADANFTGGTPFTNWTGAIDTTGLTSPAPQAVYQSERFGAMTYTIPGLTAGTSYKVRLHMCENFFTSSGQRTFSVSINGTSVLTNFDIFAAAGAIHKGVIREFTVAANGSGQEVIVFTNVVNNGLVNGIEVVTASSPPAAPTGLTATAGNTQVSLSWTASSGATSYNVKRSTVNGSGYATINSPTGTSYTNTGLTNGTTYYYVVTAVNANGESGNSNQASATPVAGGSGVDYATEPFSEAVGALHAGNTGTGWAAAWTTQNNDVTSPGYNISSGSLTYTGLPTSGNKAVGGNAFLTAGRALNVTAGGPFGTAGYLTGGLIGASGKTLWFSVLLRKDTNTDEENKVMLHATGTDWNASPSLVAVGYFGTPSGTGANRKWSLQVGSTTFQSGVAVTTGTTALLVGKIVFGATNTVSLYVNPTGLGGSAPGTASASGSTTSSCAFKNLAYYAGNGPGASTLDEIRFGDSFAAVTN